MSPKLKMAVFMDRDGVINPCPPFVNSPESFSLLPQVRETLQRLKDAGYALHIVTNQGGIGLGFMTPSDMVNINLHMMDLLPMIDSVEYCPHKPDAGCDCRKPKGKLIREVIDVKGYDPEKCWMVGDQWTDVLAGRDAGLKPSKCLQIQANTNALSVMAGLIIWRTKQQGDISRNSLKKISTPRVKLTDQELRDRKNERNRQYRRDKKKREEEANNVASIKQ